MKARVKKQKYLIVCLLISLEILFLSFYTMPLAQAFNPETGDDIFWEYGGESGLVDDTIDGFEYNTALWYDPYVDATYVSSPVRTGTGAVKMWTIGDSSLSSARRMHLRKGNVPQFEEWNGEDLYFSMWVYIPDDNNIHDEDVGWVDLFGFQAFWRGDNNPSGGRYRADRTNWRFKLETSSSKHYFTVTYLMEWFNPSYYDTEKFWADGDGGRPEYWMSAANTTLCNQWIHLQVFMHWSNSTDGYYTAWIDNNLLANYTTPVDNDPRGWSRWSNENCEWKYPSSGRPGPLIELYHATDLPEMWYYWDDAVASSEKVSETYGVGGQTEWEDFEDGFETGDFSNWNGTQQSGGGVAPSVTSTYAYTDTYSANFTTDGAQNSYSRAMHIVQNITEVYQRSYVRYEDLPDSNNTVLWVLRVAQEDGTWIASAGVNLTGGIYYWKIGETGGTENDTQDTINADQWYELEFYFNATTNGRGRLWVNGTLMCEMTGDFSGVGNLGRVYPYLYVGDGAQASSKTVYHDNYRVDDACILR